MKNQLFILTFVLSISSVFSQAPINDNCNGAVELMISKSGYSFDNVIGTKTDISYATREVGELCSNTLEDVGNCDKTVWYKFYLPTSRNVGVKLTQEDSAIPQIFSGFSIYKVKGCGYVVSDLSEQLQPIAKFGVSGNSCLSQGYYLIQVSAKNKSKGELWVELNVSRPQSEDYDDYQTSYDFYSKNSSNSANVNLNIACSSIEENESVSINDSSYSKSVWIEYDVFNTFNNYYFAINSQNNIKYRVFMDSVNSDSIKSSKPFKSGAGELVVFQEICRYPKTRKIIIQIVATELTSYIQLASTRLEYPKDAWSTPQTTEIFDLKLGMKVRNSHRIECNGELNKSMCQSVIGNYFTYKTNKKDNFGNVVYDTFKYAGYVVINVKDAGMLMVQEDYRNPPIFYYMCLYKGDIRNNCNVTKICDSIIRYPQALAQCVTPGVYTFVLATTKLDASQLFTLNYQLKYFNANIKYQHPQTPQLIPPYKPSDKLNYRAESIDFPKKDTTIKVGNMSFQGYMNFAEFEVTEDGEMELGVMDDHQLSAVYLFKGSLKDGTAQLIDDLNYDECTNKLYYKSKNHPSYKSCFYLPKGNYTIVCMIPKAYYNKYSIRHCEYLSSVLVLMPINLCPANNNTEPQFAKKLNNNLGVFSSSFIKTPYNYSILLEFCKDCKITTQVQPNLSCYNRMKLKSENYFTYYTFYLEEDASMSLPTDFELYKGDVVADPNVIKDTSNIVSPCKYGNVICNLQGSQIYTLVLINQINSNSQNMLNFNKHIKSVNDFAINSIDLGDASQSGVSSGEFITCHTTANFNDPGNRVIYINQLDPKPMKYKDSLNFRRPDFGVGNIWYTFTAKSNSKVNVYINCAADYSSAVGTLYKYKGDFELDFNNVLSNGFDSSKAKMEFIGEIGMRQLTNLYSFVNQGCRDSRYFLIIENTSLSLAKRVSVRLSSTTIYSTSLADECSDAQTLNVNNPGTYFLSLDNTCHTYGGSPFEEWSAPSIKSSWMKIVVDSLEKFDLSIRNTKGNRVVNYTIYGGTCGALTKIGKTNDRFSYFTLSCMGKGEYFIQILSDNLYSENVDFEIGVSDGKNLVCKSYDFEIPLAQFKLKGGCQEEDSVSSVNYSTNGVNMDYTWLFNGKVFSKNREIIFNRRDKDVRDSNRVKLIVKNTLNQLSDSFELVYYKDTQLYQFRIAGPREYKCNELTNLYVATNFKNKINYNWYLNETHTISYQPYCQGPPYSKLYVKGLSDNCDFLDSVELSIVSSLNLYKDTELCTGQVYPIYNNSTAKYTIWKDEVAFSVEPGETYNISDSGQYRITYRVGPCSYSDLIDVSLDPNPPLINYNKATYVCNKDSLQLEFLEHRLYNKNWNTGNQLDTQSNLLVKKSGLFILKGRLNHCTQVQSQYTVELADLDTNLLKDTVCCFNTLLDLSSPYPSQFELIKQEPQLSEINTTKPFKRYLKLKRGMCEFVDTSYVSVYPNNGYTKDTLFCSQSFEFEMNLDAKMAKEYNWYLSSTTGRYFKAKQYGYYPVRRTDVNGCIDTIHFNLTSNCEFVVFVPDAFTPNVDGLNEAFGPEISGLYQSYHMLIFNRWGELIFNTQNSQKWQADYMGEKVQQGVYSYIITVFDVNGKPFYFKGTLTLLN